MIASVRSSRKRSRRRVFRSAYCRTASGTSMFLPLTIVLTADLQGASGRPVRGTRHPTAARWVEYRSATARLRRARGPIAGPSRPARPPSPGTAARASRSRAIVRAETAVAPASQERLGAGDQRRARRHDVIHEHEPATGHGGPKSGIDRERGRDVGGPTIPAQLVLRRRRALAPERGEDRAPERSRPQPARAAPPGRSRARRAALDAPARGPACRRRSTPRATARPPPRRAAPPGAARRGT